MLALSFARSTAPMAFALRFSILPLIDSIMHLAFQGVVEDDNDLSCADSFEIGCSAINTQLFTRTKYFEAELHRSHDNAKSRVRKTPDS